MNIGVFGDSFAARKHTNSWWKYLEAYGHTVTSYGEPASSLLYSAQLILQHHAQYDFCIWAVTQAGRMSVQHDNKWFHVTPTLRSHTWGLDYLEEIKRAYQTYLKYLYDPAGGQLEGRAVVELVANRVPNLMLIPAFENPLSARFNLIDLSWYECSQLLNRQQYFTTMQTHNDLRHCHLTEPNNQKLAQLVAENLVPGTFRADYNQFVHFLDNIDQIFSKNT